MERFKAPDALGAPNTKVFDHGAATGDIDADGDLDIVITDLAQGGKIHCLVNDGKGYMRKRQCSNIFAFGLTHRHRRDGGWILSMLRMNFLIGGVENRCRFKQRTRFIHLSSHRITNRTENGEQFGGKCRTRQRWGLRHRPLTCR